MARPEDAKIVRARELLRAVHTNLADEAAHRELVAELERERLEIQRVRSRMAALKVELELERERYAELFDFGPVGYVTLDDNGIIQSLSRAAVDLLGGERTGLIGVPLLTRVATGDRRRLLDHLRRCRTTSEPVTLDLELPRRDGGVRPAQLISRRRGLSRHGGTILTALVDLTEREEGQTERGRIESEHARIRHEHELGLAESAAKDRFLAVLSHELRNPLSPIVFTVEMLERGAMPPDRLAAAYALIRRNLDLEVRLIDDLLDVSRIAHGKLTLERQVVDLHDAVRDVVDGAASDLRRGELTLWTALEADRHRVDADPARLRQVVWNLVSNAVRNTPAGGQITISTENADDEIRLTVRDSGRGVAAHRLETIFRPFDQVEPVGRRRGGLGLGLAICRALVEAHDGRISAASDGLEQGAAFTVVLPTVRHVDPRLVPVPADVLPARRLRILLVEDDVDVAAAMAAVLELRGHDVLVAHSMAEGLAYGREAFDVLVSDIGLPDGSGVDLLRTLRQRGDVRAIAISGFGTPEDVRASLDAGFVRHLTKPVHLDALIDVVEPAVA